ncbi:MAG: site-2 protease family protein [Deltaproteobacteria bacterium]|nr:site-2 protease family protein [Deltaproteobacteria bacterium]MDQ3297179.1 M50 family metallopeptidase [Myxococcota bacterium]
MYWILAIAALGFLIVVHEAGHYFVARWCGMRVERFSIGFGPGIKALTYKSKKTGTIFQIAPIPFGGFVEIRGMNIAEDIDPDDTEAYPNRPAWQRFVTIFAGPATNYLSAIVLAFGLYTCAGVDSTQAYFGVAQVLPDYDASGKLEKNDRILKVDDVPLFVGVGETLTERVTKRQGAPLKLTVRRDGKLLDVTITPKPGKDKDDKPIFLLGIKPSVQTEKIDVGVVEAAGRAIKYPVLQTERIMVGFYDIITGKEKADVGSVVRIADEFENAFSISMERGIELLMMLSVYLGLFNLFPLPALDGGRLVFLGYEMVTRRRANPKIEAMIHMGGIMVLGVLLILVTIKDCSRFF